MSMTYRTSRGDVLDWIVWRHYDGRQAGVIERVLEANPGLAEVGPVLPAGVLIVLPDIPPPEPQPRINIWD
jgi:phage tail protein X